jgi:hypothetical protein
MAGSTAALAITGTASWITRWFLGEALAACLVLCEINQDWNSCPVKNENSSTMKNIGDSHLNEMG